MVKVSARFVLWKTRCDVPFRITVMLRQQDDRESSWHTRQASTHRQDEAWWRSTRVAVLFLHCGWLATHLRPLVHVMKPSSHLVQAQERQCRYYDCGRRDVRLDIGEFVYAKARLLNINTWVSLTTIPNEIRRLTNFSEMAWAILDREGATSHVLRSCTTRNAAVAPVVQH